jgi:hypothetical protein
MKSRKTFHPLCATGDGKLPIQEALKYILCTVHVSVIRISAGGTFEYLSVP